MTEIINITEIDSTIVQKRYYEYMSSLHVLEYMVESNKFPQDLINQYIKVSENKNIDFELAKNELIMKYPCSKKYKEYFIDFNNNFISYTTKED